MTNTDRLVEYEDTIRFLSSQLADLEARDRQNVLDWQKEFRERSELAEKLQAANEQIARYETVECGEITELEKKLQAATARAGEAEKERELSVSANHAFSLLNQGLLADKLALEAHVEKLTTAFKLWFYQGSSELVSAALSSQPDLSLIEEVRKELNWLADYMCDGLAADKINRLLARLNGRKSLND